MLVINIMVIVYSSEWLCWHWTTAPVRVSQPCFLLLVLFGCLISSFAIVPMALQEDTNGEPEAACMAMPWLYSVGFSITFGTLFAKIRRVYKLFAGGLPSSSRSTSSNAGGVSYRRNYFPVADTLCCVGSVLLVDVIILVCWTKIDPLKWERVVIREDQFGDPLESRGVCTSDSWEVFALIIALFHFGLMAVACYMCYVARNIPSKFSEHKFVTIAMISNLQIFVVGGKSLD
jgi:gamma-aminobutyric acid type B receptor